MNSNFTNPQKKEKQEIKENIIISNDKARGIAEAYNQTYFEGGEWSKLYSLHSYGFYLVNQQKYLDEIEYCMSRENFTVHTALEQLKEWVLYKGKTLDKNEIWPVPDDLDPFWRGIEDHFDQRGSRSKSAENNVFNSSFCHISFYQQIINLSE